MNYVMLSIKKKKKRPQSDESAFKLSLFSQHITSWNFTALWAMVPCVSASLVLQIL